MQMEIKKQAWYLIVLTILLYVGVVVAFFLNGVFSVYDYFVRLGILVGFTSLFLSSVTTPFMKELYKLFGKPFVKIHHVFSILGIVLITSHPIAYAIQASNITVFIPDFSSWQAFWELAGRPALYIIYIAVITAVIRKRLPQKAWRAIHGLNYIAIIFAYFHGVLIGTDFQNLFIMILFTAMFVITI
jgi:predicted ferric reductase